MSEHNDIESTLQRIEAMRRPLNLAECKPLTGGMPRLPQSTNRQLSGEVRVYDSEWPPWAIIYVCDSISS